MMRRTAAFPALAAMLLGAVPARAGIEDRTYASRLMGGREVAFKVYTPPGYEAGQGRYPVVYNLHGAGGGSPDRQWDRVRKTLVDAMEGSKVRPMIYVFASGLGDTFFVDTHDGKILAEGTFIKELIPHVDAHWRTIASREGRAIDGFSMGGFACMSLAMRHPDLFRTTVSYGAALIDSDRVTPGSRLAAEVFGDKEGFERYSPWALVRRDTDAIRPRLRIRMVCGDQDKLFPDNVRFKDLLEANKIPVSWVVVPGVAHDTKGLFDRVGLESLRFIAEGFDGGSKEGNAGSLQAAKWSPHDLSFHASRAYDRWPDQVELSATFKGPGGDRMEVKGFWDGGATFKVRWTPTAEGAWTFSVRSSDPAMDGRSGRVECVPPTAGSRGFLRRDDAFPYHFIHDDGKRPYIWGQTYYRIMDNALAGDRWKEAVDRTRDYGMTKIRFYAYKSGGPNGGTGRLAPDPSSAQRGFPDLAFHRKLDEVISYMAGRGVIADLILFGKAYRFSDDEADDLRYVRYLVARYAAFPNVAWCVSNEWNYTPKPIEYWNRIGRLIRAGDPWAVRDGRPRMLSIHQQTRWDFQFFGQDWLSHAIVQVGVRNRQKDRKDEWKDDGTNASRVREGDAWGNRSILLNRRHRIPVINDEYGYIGEPKDDSEPRGPDGKSARLTREKHRGIIWGIATAGGYGSAGDKNDYDDGRPYGTANWHDTPEYGDIRRLVDFFSGRVAEPWRMEPANDAVRSGRRVYVLAEPGRRYVAYAAVGGPVVIGLAPGDYRATRYDPRTGDNAEIGRLTGGQAAAIELPEGQDWVVLLVAEGRGDRR